MFGSGYYNVTEVHDPMSLWLRMGECVKFPGQMCYVTLEWPRNVITTKVRHAHLCHRVTSITCIFGSALLGLGS